MQKQDVLGGMLTMKTNLVLFDSENIKHNQQLSNTKT